MAGEKDSDVFNQAIREVLFEEVVSEQRPELCEREREQHSTLREQFCKCSEAGRSIDGLNKVKKASMAQVEGVSEKVVLQGRDNLEQQISEWEPMEN